MTTKAKKERFYPSTFSVIVKEHEAANILVVGTPDGLCRMGFKGRATKSNFNYSFRTSIAAEKYVDEWFAQAVQDYERAAAFKALCDAPHSLTVGTVLYSSCGYEQTNIAFFEVVSICGKAMVEIREIEADKISDGPQTMTGIAFPKLTAFVGESRKLKANGLNAVKISGYQTAAPLEFTEGEGGREYMAKSWSSYG